MGVEKGRYWDDHGQEDQAKSNLIYIIIVGIIVIIIWLSKDEFLPSNRLLRGQGYWSWSAKLQKNVMVVVMMMQVVMIRVVDVVVTLETLWQQW